MTMTLGYRNRVDTLPDLTQEPTDRQFWRRGNAEWTAVVTLTAAFVFQPILHPSGPGNSSPVDVFLLASIVTAAVWARSGHHKLRAPYFFPVALMVGAGAASGIAGPLPGLALATLAIDLLLFAWCTVIVNLLNSPRAMHYALVAWSWAGIFWATVVVGAWLGHLTALEGLQAAEGNRVLFTFGDPNYAATYWCTTIFVVYASRTPTTRWMRVAGYVMLAWALALSESNGGILALGVGVFFLLLIRAYRRRGMVGSLATGLVIVLVVGAFVAMFPLNQIRQRALNSGQPLLVNSIGRSGQSTSERGQLDVELIQLYRQSDGLVGLGPASTKSILSARNYPYPNEAHNDFLAALTERGVLGLLGLLLLVGAVTLWAAPLVRRPLSAGFAAVVPRPAGLVAALLALAFVAYYEETLHFRFVWALFGIVAILGKDAKR
jgi:O-antigen ligase